MRGAHAAPFWPRVASSLHVLFHQLFFHYATTCKLALIFFQPCPRTIRIVSHSGRASSIQKVQIYLVFVRWVLTVLTVEKHAQGSKKRHLLNLLKGLFKGGGSFRGFLRLLSRARSFQNEMFASPLPGSDNAVNIFNVWPQAFARGINAVKVSSTMGTMNIRKTRRAPTVPLNTSLHFLRLASQAQVRGGEKGGMVILSSGALTSVPRHDHLVLLALRTAWHQHEHVAREVGEPGQARRWCHAEGAMLERHCRGA
jgi:hypothetical protein